MKRVAACLLLAGFAVGATAQQYPSKAIRMVVGFAGTQLDPMSPEQFATFLHAEIGKYAKLVKAANVSLD
jgi:tripartite-type tricarboxylate transporter receptor subunit TctC